MAAFLNRFRSLRPVGGSNYYVMISAFVLHRRLKINIFMKTFIYFLRTQKAFLEVISLKRKRYPFIISECIFYF